jgi:hypothetical protein
LSCLELIFAIEYRQATATETITPSSWLLDPDCCFSPALLSDIITTPVRHSAIAIHSTTVTRSLLIKIPKILVKKGDVYHIIVKRYSGINETA